MAKWEIHDLGLVNVDDPTAILNTLDKVLGPLTDALNILVSVLNLVSIFVFGLPNVLQAIVEAAINTIDQMIVDLLQNNVAFAVHINMKWQSKWKFARSPEDVKPGTTALDPITGIEREVPGVADFTHDLELPFTGTGTAGWLLDVGYAANDPTNPFRPLTDGDTAVSGVIFLKGVPAGGELENLVNIFDMFFDFGGFRDWLKVKKKLEKASEDFKALLRLGPVAFEEEVVEAFRPFDEIVQSALGSVIVEGGFGKNDPGSNVFYDTSFGGPFGPLRRNDTLKIHGETTFYNVILTDAIDTTKITVEPSILRAHNLPPDILPAHYTIYRGGLESLLKGLPTDLRQFAPKPGNYPIWVSVPVASLIPAVGALLEGFRELANSLRAGLSQLAALQNLILLIQQKIELIRRAIEELRELIIVLAAVLEFFDETHMIAINLEEGGMGSFINSAIAGEDFPFFGDRGVVVGMVAVATSDDPSNHLESFFELVGIQFQDFSEDVTAAEEDRQETWEDVFPP